jgi:predicted  nucleic acid-binding Zn-ribbon protein
MKIRYRLLVAAIFLSVTADGASLKWVASAETAARAKAMARYGRILSKIRGVYGDISDYFTRMRNVEEMLSVGYTSYGDFGEMFNPVVDGLQVDLREPTELFSLPNSLPSVLPDDLPSVRRSLTLMMTDLEAGRIVFDLRISEIDRVDEVTAAIQELMNKIGEARDIAGKMAEVVANWELFHRILPQVSKGLIEKYLEFGLDATLIERRLSNLASEAAQLATRLRVDVRNQASTHVATLQHAKVLLDQEMIALELNIRKNRAKLEEFEAAKQELDRLNAAKMALRSKLNANNEKLDELDLQHIEAEKNIKSYRSQLADYSRQLSGVEASLNQVVPTCQNVSPVSKHTYSQLANFACAASDQDRRFAQEWNRQLEEIAGNFRSAQSTLSSTQNRINKILTEMKSCRNEIQRLKPELDTAEMRELAYRKYKEDLGIYMLQRLFVDGSNSSLRENRGNVATVDLLIQSTSAYANR